MPILILLPPKSLFRFLSVSKLWFSIITDPIFIKKNTACLCRRSAATGGGRPLAFFQRPVTQFGENTILPIKNNQNIMKNIPKDLGYFINLSNSLIRCSRDPSAVRFLDGISSTVATIRHPIYQVVNPVTGKKVPLLLPPPPPNNCYYYNSVGIMCEGNLIELVANYIVVRASIPFKTTHDNWLYIETYSSRSGAWASSLLAATDNFRLRRHPPVVTNGVFHWYLDEFNSGIAVYDPNDGENHLQLIRLPDFNNIWNWNENMNVNSTWLGLTRNGRMQVFKLPKGKMGSYQRKTTIGCKVWVQMYNLGIESMRLQALISWNSSLVAVVMERENVFLYDWLGKTVEIIEYDGVFF